MTLLEAIQSKHIHSMAVKIGASKELRTYSVGGLLDALSSLIGEVNVASEAAINAVEEKYEHDRADVLRIGGRLVEIVAATSTGNEYGTAIKQFSTF